MVEWIVPFTDGVVALLLMVIGGNLGSFLNVVAHRLPLGLSVVHGGSRCPDCGAAIRWHDNVPVLGWLLLGGRCRDCRGPIAPRYPLVEATAAIVIGGVAACELLSGGGTVPYGTLGPGRPGADNLLLRPDWRLVAYAALHAWLLFDLLLAALVEADGRVVPRRWTAFTIAATLAVVVPCDWLLPVGPWPGAPGSAWAAAPGWVPRGLVVGLVGLAVGGAAGAVVSPALRDGLGLVGVALGWQGALGVLALLPVCRGLRRLAGALTAPGGAGRGPGPAAPEWATASCHDGAAAPADGPEAAAPGGDASPGTGAGAAPTPAGEMPACPLGIPSGQVVAEPASAGRRLRAAAAAALGRSEGLGGDLLLATAVQLVTWRWWAGLWG